MSNSSNRQSDINTFLTIIEQQNNTIALLTKNGEDMQNTIRDLRQTIANLEETIAEHEAYLAALKEHRGNDAYNILLSHLLMPIKIHDHEV